MHINFGQAGLTQIRWCLIGGLVVSLLGCEAEIPPEKDIIRPVRYEMAQAVETSRIRSFSGSAQAGVESKLSFKVPGTIQELPVTVGGLVKRGQLIASLDAEDFQLQVAQAEAAMRAAEAQERHANAEYRRVQQLYENNNASKSSLDAGRSASEAAQEQVKAMTKQLELAKRQFSYARLVAPTDGAIVIVLTEVGENIAAGMPVVLLSAGSDTEVKLAIPENVIASIHEGMQGSVRFPALPDKEFPVVVTEVGVAVTGAMSTYPVTVRLEQAHPAIRPGMAAAVSFRFGEKDAARRILLPPVSVGEDMKGNFVFLLEHTRPGFARTLRQGVTVGEMSAAGIEILKGVSEGDSVVTAGVGRIRDGQEVRVPEREEKSE